MCEAWVRGLDQSTWVLGVLRAKGSRLGRPGKPGQAGQASGPPRHASRQDLVGFIKDQREAAEKRRRKAEAGRAASKTGASTEDEDEDDKQAPLSPVAPPRSATRRLALCCTDSARALSLEECLLLLLHGRGHSQQIRLSAAALPDGTIS